MWRRYFVWVAASALAAACSAVPGVQLDRTPAVVPAREVTVETPTVRLLFVGDVMLGRGVAPAVATGPDSLFREARAAIRAADLAAFNLESPLTTKPQISTNPNNLIADPAAALLLAHAGFDIANLANNHTGDGGPASIAETVDSLADSGIVTVGVEQADGGDSAAMVVDVGGIGVGFAAFTFVRSDAVSSGVSIWDEAIAKQVIADLQQQADLVVASLHGGLELIPLPADDIEAAADLLVGWGVDIIWGHGPHVTHQPTLTAGAGDEPGSVLATSLGNFLFDQHLPTAQSGLVLEVIAGRDGLVAYRVADTAHDELGVHSINWRLPSGDAVLFGDSWWTPARPFAPDSIEDSSPLDFPHGDVIAAATGDATDDGKTDLVVAYRHPFRETPLNRLAPDRVWQDSSGRSAHIGVFTPDGTPVWAAGTLADPVNTIAPCDGAVGVVYSTFDGAPVGTGALRWLGFGLFDVQMLPGPGSPGCSDLDGDGHREVVVTNRANL